MRSFWGVLSAGLCLSVTAGAREPVVLFDGKTLKGWEGNTELWRVEGDEIVGTVKDKLGRNEFLISNQPLQDFRLIVDVKLDTQTNNSGIQFRSKKIATKDGQVSVAGYQADVGGKDGIHWGQLYHEHGRGWLSQKSCGAFIKKGGWNAYEILAVGSKVQTAINGHKCTDIDDPKGERAGVIALQLHSGGQIEVRFRNFRLEQHPDGKLRTLAMMFEPKHAVAEKGLVPDQAVRSMTVPAGFKVSLIASEPAVKQPVAMAIDHRGRLWIAEAFSYPVRRPDAEAHDRILILEDTDGDGHYETQKTFYDKLNLVSGLEIGFGGVWVGSAPHLLFIPDRDGDDVPDGTPEVMLDGWGYQDTHETLNSFIWGPDGWLYGNQGVFTNSAVGKPGTPDTDRIKMNAVVWRFHPTRHEFETFARGGSNQWGLDFDDDGQAFMTTCRSRNGGGPVTHVVQGAYYWRQSGSDPYEHVYEPIKASADHDHGLGGAGDAGSDEKYGGHAHVGTMIYLGDQWPDSYRNGLFTHNLHGQRINHELNERRGSGFVTKHAAADLFFANDPWFIGVDLAYGPEGSMFMIDWYDRQRCHHREVEKWDRTNGRIYRIEYGEPRRVKVDLAKLTDRELVELQLRKNDWYVRTARRLLQERAAERPLAADAKKALRALLDHQDPRRRLRGLWALHAVGALDQALSRKLLASKDEYLRAWTVQMLNEKKAPSDQTLTQMTTLAKRDASSMVRKYLASALQRIPQEKRWPLVEALAARAEDAADQFIPTLTWFGAEPLVTRDLSRAMKLAETTKLPLLARSIYRRASMEKRGLGAVVGALGKPRGPEPRVLVDAMTKALEGRNKLTMPAGWETAAKGLLASPATDVRWPAEMLSARFGDRQVLAQMRQRLADLQTPRKEREQAFEVLLAGQDPEAVVLYQQLLDEDPFRGKALRALARFDNAGTPEAVIDRYARWSAADKAEAVTTLITRPSYAVALLAAMEAGRMPPKDLTPFAARQLAKFESAEIAKRLAKVWGTTRKASGENVAVVARYKKVYTGASDWMYDASAGRAVFGKACAPCHKLFGEGGEIGPDLTGSNRELDYLLENIVDPSAVIGRDYQLSTIKTRNGSFIAGMIHGETDTTITVKTVTETQTVARRDVESVETSDASMMPEGLLPALSDEEARNLLRYLMSPTQVPLAAEQKK